MIHHHTSIQSQRPCRISDVSVIDTSKATASELRTLASIESRIEQVAAVIGRGWNDGECQIAKKVDPNRSAKMPDRIKAMMSALTVMEYDLRKASAAADLLQGMQ